MSRVDQIFYKDDFSKEYEYIWFGLLDSFGLPFDTTELNLEIFLSDTQYNIKEVQNA